jgi:hypothetical protein
MPHTSTTLFLLLIILASCDLWGSNEPLKVKAVPISGVEMAIDIRTTKGGSVQITRNGQDIAAFKIANKDTIYIDSDLSPLTSYSWRVRSGGETVGIRAATLDSTSSQFIWHTYTFGGTAGSSEINDVAIIDENNIWAVGEIYVLDEAHINGYQMYNAVHWNGETWELKRIPYFYQNQAFFNPIQTVFSFDANDIWFAGNGVIHWDGNDFIPIAITQSVWRANQINKIWGTSPEDIYIVGNTGSIAHFNGAFWRKIESGTNLHFYDIWGDVASGKSKPEIIAVAGERFISGRMKFLSIEDTRAHELSTDSIAGTINSIWFMSGRAYFAAGGGIYSKPTTMPMLPWQLRPTGSPPYYIHAIRGNDINDVVAVGDFGELLHFNGIGWRSFLEADHEQTRYSSLDFKNDTVVATGFRGSAATIRVGKR